MPRRQYEVLSPEALSRVEEARTVLRAIGFDKSRSNHRSALVLLALLDLGPEDGWQNATGRSMGVRQILRYIADVYGLTFSDREAPRRQTLHQFRDAGLVVENVEAPATETNHPRFNYQLEDTALSLLRTVGTRAWDENLAEYKGRVGAVRLRVSEVRRSYRVSLRLPSGDELSLGPGRHNQLIRAVVEEFSPRFLRDPVVLYVGDTGNKTLLVRETELRALGIELDAHGQLPDVVLLDRERNWLVLVEAVTSHGPVSETRHRYLRELFASASAGLVYLTAFPNKARLARHIAEIGWETEVWVADDPDHLVHFDGERFLGPYDPLPSTS